VKSRFPIRILLMVAGISLCVLGVAKSEFTAETQRTLSSRRETALLSAIAQGPELDYSTFKHSSQRHASLACTACHQRAANNSPQPLFPGHDACKSCHLNQFLTSSSPFCVNCHTDVNSGKPPLKNFTDKFKESFNVKFDHAQHMNSATRPRNGCAACHAGSLNRGTALAIPTGPGAHSQCYVCHTPGSKSSGGHDLASCGVCHDTKSFARTSTNAVAFRASFSHAKHGSRQKLDCGACHTLAAGLAQGKQVSLPRTAEHFAVSGTQSCLSCHNGKRSFGGDLAFKDCQRCHAGANFRMPG
jgi:c(7)-type cytochrome triheme protein